ncbi:MAG: hypothetical protein ABIG20_05135 [archaeon]
MKKLPVIAVIIAIIMISGCIDLPITPESEILEYELYGDGSIKQTSIQTGLLKGNADDWPSDCTQNMTKMLNAMKAMMEAGMSMQTESGEMSADEQAKTEKAIAAFDRYVDSISCKFEKSGDSGTITISSTQNYDDIQALSEMSEASGQGSEPSTGAKKKDGKIYTNINLSSGLFGDSSSTPSLKEVRIKVQGDVETMPLGYEMDGDVYVYKNPSVTELAIVYARSGGISLTDPIVLGGIVAAILVVVIIVVLVIKKRKKKVKEQETAEEEPQLQPIGESQLNLSPAVIDYVRAMRAQGYPDEQIGQALLAGGHPQEKVYAYLRNR